MCITDTDTDADTEKQIQISTETLISSPLLLYEMVVCVTPITIYTITHTTTLILKAVLIAPFYLVV